MPAQGSNMKKTFLCWSLAAAAALPAFSQTTLPAVTVSGRADPPLAVGGFDGVPLAQTPLQATRFDATALRDAGAVRLSDIARLDAAVGDTYNAEGYWDSLTVRGFVTDNRYNYQRDGLPINAETSLPLDNKERIELLKGLSGLQAGVSAPGGLVNLVVKRPLAQSSRSALLGWRERGSLLGAVDVSQRLGDAAAVRVNAAYEHLDPTYRDTRGHRRLLAVAGEIAPTAGLLIEAEFETSRRSQPSVPGFSLLGNRGVPDADTIDPRINLNNQPWVRPVVLDAASGSLRVTQRLSADWRAVAHFGTQRLTSDDRTAFPFGCGKEGNFDRYCSDGTFDYYDFVSDDERRRTDVLDLSLRGRTQWLGVEHRMQVGVQRSRFSARFGLQLFAPAGEGNIDGSAVVPRAVDPPFANTNRDRDATELYLRDAVRITPTVGAWFGLRHTRLEQRSVLSDGTEPSPDAPQSFTAPWLAFTYAPRADQLLYASWGEGVESYVAPNRPEFTNRGRPLPALKSRQFEFGWKAGDTQREFEIALFDIRRPQFVDLCVGSSCTSRLDGSVRHSGVDAKALWRHGAWSFGGGAQWLRARREGSTATPELNGLRPFNVPRLNLRALAGYDVASAPGLRVEAALAHEGDRMVLPDNSARIDGWTRVDAAARYAHRIGNTQLTWRLGVHNLADRRAWKEAPFQFGHAYLFPLAPRTWRLSLQADL
jgi:iron complex outermembrane receptor protein